MLTAAHACLKLSLTHPVPSLGKPPIPVEAPEGMTSCAKLNEFTMKLFDVTFGEIPLAIFKAIMYKAFEAK